MFLAINKDGKEWIYEEKPVRHTNSDFWISNSWYIKVPKGTIQRLLDYPLTWEDEAEEIVEYKDNILKEFKVIKQNIKMRVTPEQSAKVQEICFENGISWISGADIKHFDKPFIFINDDHSLGYRGIDEVEGFLKEEGEEIDADLFIRTNGACVESGALTDSKNKGEQTKNTSLKELRPKTLSECLKENNAYEGFIENCVEKFLDDINVYNEIKIESKAGSILGLGSVFNWMNTKQGYKYWSDLYFNNIDILIYDMDEIIFAEVDKGIAEQKIVNLHDQLNKNRKTVQNQKEELTRLLSQKEDLQNRLNIANKTVGMSINNDIELIRLLEEKDAIIKYLESKLEI